MIVIVNFCNSILSFLEEGGWIKKFTVEKVLDLMASAQMGENEVLVSEFWGARIGSVLGKFKHKWMHN